MTRATIPFSATRCLRSHASRRHQPNFHTPDFRFALNQDMEPQATPVGYRFFLGSHHAGSRGSSVGGSLRFRRRPGHGPAARRLRTLLLPGIRRGE